jgi:signal transduction histidine kinase
MAAAVHTVEKAVDPALLPYQFKTHSVLSILHAASGEIQPMPIKGQKHPGRLEFGDQYRGDSLSFIIFSRDLLTGGPINQVNRKVWKFIGRLGGDPDGDGEFEVAVTYQQGDELVFELIEVGGETVYKRVMCKAEDHNRDGRWDGQLSIFDLHDLNGDGFGEYIMAVFSGFDLLPRAYICLDWHNDSTLWQYDVAGLPGYTSVITDKSWPTDRIVLWVHSMGNAVATETMNDQHSYLICLDAMGKEVFVHEAGGVFSLADARLFDVDSDGTPEILAYVNFGQADSTGDKGSLISLFSTEGVVLDTLRLPEGPTVRQLTIGDLDRDGTDEILICTSENQVLECDASLNELSRHQFESEPTIWKVADFVGNGKHQLMASTIDGMTYLLDENFDLLAQYEGQFYFRYSYMLDSGLTPVGPAMMLCDKAKSQWLVMYFEKQPFLTILTTFMVRHRWKFLTVLCILAAALVATNYHRRRIRRNLNLISRQRDELEQTRNELQKTMVDLVSAQTQLVQSEKMASLGMLVAGIAHEINNALGALSSNNNTAYRALGHLRQRIAELGQDEPGLAELVKKLDVAEASSRSVGDGADTIAQIVKRLRSFARLDEAELQRIDLHECLDETVGLLHDQMKQTIIVNKEYGDVPKIACYPSQLNQVFLNLLVNAKESIPGRGEITIRTCVKNEMAVVDISDSGTGIPTDRLDKIFDPGFTTKGVGVGTGLGLAICYQIVSDHRGDISVTSDAGKGTTFTVRLPLKVA